MDIPLPIPTSQDIFSYGFNPSLSRGSAIQSSTAYNIFDQTNTATVASGGSLNLSGITVNTPTQAVLDNANIGLAINNIKTAKGGELRLGAGMFTSLVSITGVSKMGITGSSSSETIIDFSNGSNTISFQGTDNYTTGTITSISGVTVTGSGTTWTTALNITASSLFFISNKWYAIKSIDTDTQITLAEEYIGGATFPGASYILANAFENITLKNILIKNSGAIQIAQAKTVTLENCIFEAAQVDFTNVSDIKINNVKFDIAASDNLTFSTCGHGELTNVSSIKSGADGIKFTSCNDFVLLNCAANLNGGKGIEGVSGNKNIRIISSQVNSNTSDGIKLTASSNECSVDMCDIESNGGYGLNIAANTDNNTFVGANYYASNTSGAVNDQGTSTKFRGNNGKSDNVMEVDISLSDNTTDNVSSTAHGFAPKNPNDATQYLNGAGAYSFPQGNVQTFTSSGTWTKPANGNFVFAVCVGGGGGGGGSGTGATGGTGGGGGAITQKLFAMGDISATAAVTVGAGGAGASGSGTTGGAGSSSSFGPYLIAYGGGGGINSNNGSGGGGGGSAGVGQVGQGGATSLGGSPASVSGAAGIAWQGGGGNYGPAAGSAAGASAEWGGGAGGGINSANTPFAGGSALFACGGGGAGSTATGVTGSGAAGGTFGSYVAGGGGAAGVPSGTDAAPGGNGASFQGGGGGASGSTNANLGAGGNGGYGGGGGGLARSVTSANVFAGTGGTGKVLIYTW